MRHVVILPSLNGDLLGDKILLSAIAGEAIQAGSVVWGLEETELLPMRCFHPSPQVITHGPLGSLSDVIALASHEFKTQPRVLLCEDHRSASVGHLVPATARVEVRGLWEELAQLGRKGIFPRTMVTRRALVRARERLAATCGSADAPFVAMHVRSIGREQDKNIDTRMCADIAEDLVEYFGCHVILIGHGDRRVLVSGRRIVDFLPLYLSVEDTAALLRLAALFIGTDSGPIHLAASVGCPVIGIGYKTTRFGPFAPASQLLGLFGSNVPGIRHLASIESVRQRIVESETTSTALDRRGLWRRHRRTA